MDRTYPPEAWKRLGDVLQEWRGRLGYGYRQRGRFLADRGGPPPSEKMLARLERGERTAYPASTLTLLETLYGMAAGSFEKILAGGDPVPLRDGAPHPAPGREEDPGEQVLADITARYPGDTVIAAIAAQSGKPARTRVAEILEWLEVRTPARGDGNAG